MQQRQKLLETQRQELDIKLAEIDAKRKSYDTEVAAAVPRVKKERFAKTLAMYSELKPKQEKEIFLGLEQQTVSDYITEMEADQATTVIGEFLSADERAFFAKILERIRVDGTGPANGSVGAGAPGAAMSALSANQARN